VFIARDGGQFEAREVVLGTEMDDGQCQVFSGLAAGERVVTSGQFLLDSESQLREAIDKMRGSDKPGAAAESSAVKTNLPAATPAVPAESAPVVYVCPMPEHVSIVYDHAGNCPICGMTLVPVSPESLRKIQPGGQVLYYTCPMPEHASVHEDKPGKCPLCAMTLIPVMAPPVAAPAAAPAKAKQQYTCPMHPEVIADTPGKCPKCDMDLVPVKPN
jgi:rubrerythrin